MESKVEKNGENSFPLSFVYFFLFILSSCLGLVSRLQYRDYIHSSHINDFGLSDSLPSFFFITGFIFLYFLFCKLSREAISFVSMVFITLGALAYEFFPLSHGGIIDIKDILATLIGAALAAMIFYVLEGRTKTGNER